MKQEHRNFLSDLNFTRKPSSLEEIQNQVKASKLKSMNLAEYEFNDLFVEFKTEMPRFFIFKAKNNKKYLVDTQGYSYMRYLIEIVGA